MAPTYQYEEPSAPVQFVSPGQGYYNPPPDSQAYRITMGNIPPMQNAAAKSPAQSEKSRVRPLSVDEALQFSPLSSIIPYDAGMLPIPAANVQISKSAFHTAEQRMAGTKILYGLNQEMVQSRGASPHITKTLQGMQSLLKANEIPLFEFKTLPMLPGGSRRKLAEHGGSKPLLSPFARLLVDRSNVQYRVGTSPLSQRAMPKSRSVSSQPAQDPASQSKQHLPQRKPSKSHTPGPVTPRQAHIKLESPNLEPSEPRLTLNPSLSEQVNQRSFEINNEASSKTPSIVVPLVPPEFHTISSDLNPDEKTEIKTSPPPLPQPHAPSPPLTSNTTPDRPELRANLHVLIEAKSSNGNEPLVKQQPGPDSADSKLQVLVPTRQQSSPNTEPRLKVVFEEQPLSQKATTDATVNDLQSVINEVLETEAEAQSNGLSRATDGIITSAGGADGDVYIITSAALIRLDSLFRKAIEKRKLVAIQLDSILHLQRLCERSFSCAENMSINLSSDWVSFEEAARNHEAATCEQSLQAARVILRSMTGGRADKQILSEELLQQCITLLNRVVDSLILPAVEARSSGADSAVYETAIACKKSIASVLFQCSKLMQMLLQILAREEIAETAVNQIEYFAIRMLFVENAPSEKESVLGIAKFESFRRYAMLVLVEVFSRYHDQRQFIISEVLTSLQKLPTARQHGRQFKLEDGKRLQLVTVLLVNLVQASGVNTDAKSSKTLFRAETTAMEADEGSDSEDSEDDEPRGSRMDLSEDDGEDENSDILPPKLIKNLKRLHDASMNTAWHIVSFLVQKALTASKSGEQPHRHLLDMFVEDLIAVLSSPEWPGAELLLQLLVNKMKELAESPKTNAPTKTMALETLGTLGTAILDVTFEAQNATKSLENDDSTISAKLHEQFDNNMQGHLDDLDVCNWKGPFRLVMDYSEENGHQGRTNSAQGFLLTKWAKTLIWGGKGTNHVLDETRISGGARSLALSLSKMTLSGKWENSEPAEVTASQARLAYLISILHIGFCQSFGFILSLLMSSITSEHITVRARSLRSVTQMLEKDPSLLDRHRSVLGLILKCTSDPSASVKDSSLALLGKCITLRPSIEREVIQAIIHASSDQTVGIRKRALKLLRDAYLRQDANAHQWRVTVKTLAVGSVARRIGDEEESVVDLTQQIFEEIWLDPFRDIVSQDKISSSGNILLKEQAAIIIQTLQDHDDLSKSIEELFRHALSPKGKAADSSRRICKALVSCAFEGIIDSSDLPGTPAQHEILKALAIFARTDPKLFTAEHVELLKPYVSCLSNGDDLNLFRGVVAIFRSVLPTLPSVQQESLRKIQNDLQSVIPKLPKVELDEVASCLWTICVVLKNPERLVKLTVSCLQNLQKLQGQLDMPEALVQKVQRLIRIAGHFGKYCDFQPQFAFFKSQLPSLKGDLVAGKIVSGIQPFTNSKRPLNCRAVAWEGIGMICQSWPRTFSDAHISREIQNVLQDDELELQRIILASIRDFFSAQDQTHDTEANALLKDPLAKGKLGGSMTATDNDGAAALIAQAYLKHILRIALQNIDNIALVATEVVSGISKQGLVHPKEVGPAMVALATSPSLKVVNVALQQLQALHSQHETLFEREYMRAVHEAFVYQRDVVKNPSGYTSMAPMRAKLHHVYEVIKTSKVKFVNKFLTNVCGRLDFDFVKLESSLAMPPHLQYARFLIENLVFFEFGRLEDVHHVVTCLEKIVAATGSIVAHAINTELLKVTIENMLGSSLSVPEADAELDLEDGTLGGFLPEPVPEPILASVEDSLERKDESVHTLDPGRLRHLSVAAVILTLIWETRTFIKRVYNINSNPSHKGKTKNPKDPNKAPVRSNFASSEKYLELVQGVIASLDTEEASRARCKKFAELMAIDDELKVANGDDDDLDADVGDVGGEGGTVDDVGRGTKRKGSVSSAGTPKKKQRSKPPRSIGGDSRRGSPDADMWD